MKNRASHAKKRLQWVPVRPIITFHASHGATSGPPSIERMHAAMGKVLPKKRHTSKDEPSIRKRREDLSLARKVGERMRELRLALRLSLAQLHERGAPTPGQMSAIENGKVDFTVDTIVNVAAALRVRPWQLLTDDALLAFDLDEARRILFVLPDVSVLEPPPIPKRARPWDHLKARKGGKL